jgi:rubrerythrin
MPSYSQIRSKLARFQREMRRAQQDLERSARNVKYELEHPQVEIVCTCGYRSQMRRSVRSLPERCPSCGSPIAYC